MLQELEQRSDGRVESGAFLLGRVFGDIRQVETCVYYDDLAEDALHPTHVYVPSEAYQALWGICLETGLRVIADIHTHPGMAIQSATDRAHPMIPEVGHVAMIVPTFAKSPVLIDEIGIYEYRGSFQWRLVPRPEMKRTLRINGQ